MRKGRKNRNNKKAVLNGIILGLFVVLGFQSVCRPDNITISLNFPQKSSMRIRGAKAILSPIEVSGSITLSVSPYPNVNESNQCKVEYYLNEKLLYETEGAFDPGCELLSFKYEFDTTKFENGKYRLYVNYSDKEGATAIGSQRIIIINKQEE